MGSYESWGRVGFGMGLRGEGRGRMGRRVSEHASTIYRLQSVRWSCSLVPWFLIDLIDRFINSSLVLRRSPPSLPSRSRINILERHVIMY